MFVIFSSVSGYFLYFQDFLAKRSDSRVPNLFPERPDAKLHQTHELDNDDGEEENSSSSN